jgi:diacylglycerol kinase (ATP)
MTDQPPTSDHGSPDPHPGAEPRPPGFVVIANASAGSTEVAAVGTAVAHLAARGPTRLVWTESHPQFVEAVRDVAETDALVVAGGDGSIHRTLETVVDLGRTDRAVGIIPLGTGNDFARNRGIPLDPGEAATVVIDGEARGIDAMELAGEREDGESAPGRQMVANNIHVGLGVRAARRASGLKSLLKRFAYPVATAYEGVRGEALDLAITVDGEEVWDGPLLAALMLLGPNMGGGVAMVPDDRSGIDVVLVEPAGADERVELVRAALRGRVFDAQRAHRRHGSSVTVAGRDGLVVNVDGEIVRYRTPVELTHRLDAWKIVLPAR